MDYILPVIQTQRLSLRPWSAEDIDTMHQLWTGAEMRRYLWDDLAISRVQAAETVMRAIESAERPGVGMWSIRERESGEAIGFCGLRCIDGLQDVEVLYGLAPAAWKQGLAFEAARAVIDYGFATGRFDRVFGRTDELNRASIRVLERLGMRFESLTLIEGRPTAVYSLKKPMGASSTCCGETPS